jgi:hypothetical protein
MSGAERASATAGSASTLPAAGALRARFLLPAAGVALAGSLFLPWFEGISGWEQFAWADVVLAVLAADLAASGFLRPLVAHRIVVAVLCALGVAVVLGHGFEPRPDFDESAHGFPEVLAGPYVCLAALVVGFVAALAPWPRPAGRLLLVAGAAGIVVALFSGWSGEPMSERAGSTYAQWARAYPDAFARWKVLDIVLVALVLGLLAVATGRAPRRLSVLLGATCLLAAACVAAGGDRGVWIGENGFALGPARGSIAALLGLGAAIGGLVLFRPLRGTTSQPLRGDGI